MGQTCEHPPLRREWRSLTTEEKAEFVRGVKTLAQTPSQWRNNGTLYDDFSILHGGIGSWCALIRSSTVDGRANRNPRGDLFSSSVRILLALA